MIPILLRIGPITIYSYGFMVALAFIIGDRLVASEFKRRGYDAGLASSLVLWVAIASFGGARLNDVIDNWRIYSADPKSIIFFKHRLCLLRRLHRGVAGQYRVRASVPNPLADACRHVRARLGPGPRNRPPRLSAFGGRGLGYTVQIALGHGLPQSDCRMECRDGNGSRQARRPDPRLLSRRSRASHAYLRERALPRRLSRTAADAEADSGRGTRLLHLSDALRSEPLSGRVPSDQPSVALGSERSATNLAGNDDCRRCVICCVHHSASASITHGRRGVTKFIFTIVV